MPFGLRALRHAAAALVLAGTAVAVSSCGSDRVIPPCPSVRVDNATATLTKFREGAAGDMSGVEYKAEIVGYKGECKFSKNEVELIMDVDFTLQPGPAAKGGAASIYYFVAIPQFFPKPEGKKIIELRKSLPSRGAAVERFRESGVTVNIPLKKDQAAAAFDVYIGLQLTSEEAEYNRAHPAR